MIVKSAKTLAAMRQRRLERDREFLEPPCPKCEKPLIKKPGPYWACSGFPYCLHTMLDEEGCPVEREKPHRTHTICPECGQRQILRRRKQEGRGFYYTCSSRMCRVWFKDDPGEVEIQIVTKKRSGLS